MDRNHLGVTNPWSALGDRQIKTSSFLYSCLGFYSCLVTLRAGRALIVTCTLFKLDWGVFNSATSTFAFKGEFLLEKLTFAEMGSILDTRLTLKSEMKFRALFSRRRIVTGTEDTRQN